MLHQLGVQAKNEMVALAGVVPDDVVGFLCKFLIFPDWEILLQGLQVWIGAEWDGVF